MSLSLDSLRETAIGMHPLHRVWVEVTSIETWYAIIREANTLYGPKNWRCQSKIRRKLERNWHHKPMRVWFDVPNPTFATWISVKHSVIVKCEVAK